MSSWSLICGPYSPRYPVGRKGFVPSGEDAQNKDDCRKLFITDQFLVDKSNRVTIITILYLPLIYFVCLCLHRMLMPMSLSLIYMNECTVGWRTVACHHLRRIKVDFLT